MELNRVRTGLKKRFDAGVSYVIAAMRGSAVDDLENLEACVVVCSVATRITGRTHDFAVYETPSSVRDSYLWRL